MNYKQQDMNRAVQQFKDGALAEHDKAVCTGVTGRFLGASKECRGVCQWGMVLTGAKGTAPRVCCSTGFEHPEEGDRAAPHLNLFQRGLCRAEPA